MEKKISEDKAKILKGSREQQHSLPKSPNSLDAIGMEQGFVLFSHSCYNKLP
jgi:hypothetical protein